MQFGRGILSSKKEAQVQGWSKALSQLLSVVQMQLPTGRKAQRGAFCGAHIQLGRVASRRVRPWSDAWRVRSKSRGPGP